MHLSYIAFVLPMKVSLNYTPTWSDVVFDNYINLVFIVDMIITFLTPLPGKEGKLVYNKKMIAIAYLKRWFFVDLLLCFPYSYFRVTSSDKYGNDP